MKNKIAIALLTVFASASLYGCANKPVESSDNFFESPIYATSGSVLDKVYNIVEQEYTHIETKENPTKQDKIEAVNRAGLLDELGIFGPYSDDVLITREMALNLVTQIVRDTHKNNVPDSFVSSLADYDIYLDREIDYVDYNNLLETGANYYHGESSAESEILKQDLEKLTGLLAQTKPVEHIAEPEQQPEQPKETITEPIINMELPHIEHKDSLSGQSVALYKQPKNVLELNANIDQLNLGSPYTSKNEYKFINVSEGLLDYSLANLEAKDGSKKKQEFEAKHEIKSLVKCSLPTGIQTTKDDNGNIILSHDDFTNMGTSYYGNDTMSFIGAYLVKDNKVVENGYIILDQYGETKFRFTEKNYKQADYIMLTTYKDVLTGNSKHMEEYGTVGMLFEIKR